MGKIQCLLLKVGGLYSASDAYATYSVLLSHTDCCCCEPGHLPGLLSFNAAVRQRWLAWEVVSRNYTVPGYSISENQADYVFNAHEYRKNYINFFVQVSLSYHATLLFLSAVGHDLHVHQITKS